MSIGVRGKYIDNGKEVANSSACAVRLQNSIGFGWSHVVDEGDILFAHSFFYFIVNTIFFLALC